MATCLRLLISEIVLLVKCSRTAIWLLIDNAVQVAKQRVGALLFPLRGPFPRKSYSLSGGFSLSHSPAALNWTTVSMASYPCEHFPTSKWMSPSLFSRCPNCTRWLLWILTDVHFNVTRLYNKQFIFGSLAHITFIIIVSLVRSFSLS